MKKTLAFSFLLLAFAVQSFATGTSFSGGSVINTLSNGSTITLSRLSNNVGAAIIANDTQYSAGTRHLNGSREFASSSAATALYYNDVTPGSAIPDKPSSNSDTTDFATWNSL